MENISQQQAQEEREKYVLAFNDNADAGSPRNTIHL